MAFNPSEHMIRVQGNREYLPVAARLLWFREEHPDWSIETESLQIDVEKQYAIFHARIKDAQGRTRAGATKMENVRGFADYVEKAETGAVGRALAYCGYGTQFAPELEEGERLADAPAVSKGFKEAADIEARTSIAGGRGSGGGNGAVLPPPPKPEMTVEERESKQAWKRLYDRLDREQMPKDRDAIRDLFENLLGERKERYSTEEVNRAVTRFDAEFGGGGGAREEDGEYARA